MHRPSAPRTVCLLCPGGFEHAGGIGRWAAYLSDAWPAVAGAPRLHVVDTRGHGGWPRAGLTFAAALARLARLHSAGDLGLIHMNLSVRGSTIRKCAISTLAWWAGVPVIVHLHSGRFPEFYRALPGWAQAAVRRMFTRAARIIVLGRVWEDVVVTELGVPRAKVTVLPNAAPLPPPRPPRPARELCHIVMLGRLAPPKGLPELLQALSSPVLRDLPWRITLAGDGDGAQYRRDAVARGIGAKVTILGWLDKQAVAALLVDADVLVLPSRSENLPVAVIEALSYGIAVVTTPVGATPEIVKDGESALLVPVQDPAALATALARMVTDSALRDRIGSQGRAVFAARLDIDRCAAALAQLYNDILEQHV